MKHSYRTGRPGISLFFFTLLSISVLLAAACGNAQRPSATVQKAAQESVPERITRQLAYLASDDMKGRFPGTREDTLAATYIRNTLMSYGYQPLADNGLQSFAISLTRMSQPADSNTVQDPSKRTPGRETRRVHTFNVVMSLFGPVDSLRETVVLGAHYDHLGMGGTGSGSRKPGGQAVHNGADDNASGVVGIMEIARKLALHRKSLKRNIVVVAFGAEEQGILGSKAFVREKVPGTGKPVLMVNLDMIGRMDTLLKLQVGGVGTFTDGEAFVQSLPNPNHFQLILSKDGFGPSDHASFYGSGIPVLYFNTGVHMDYHSPSDDVEKIETSRMSQICDYIYEAVYQIATAKQAPVYQKAGPSEATPQRAAFKVSFGLIPDFSSTDSTGLRADFITEGKPAEKAGMKAGDVIKYINGKEVFNVYDYMERLGELKAGDLVTVQVRRKEELITLEIQL